MGACRMPGTRVMCHTMTETPPSRRPTLVQVCLMSLPFGTMLLGIIAMVWYFQRDDIKARGRAEGLYGKEPTESSVADYLTKLTGPIAGVRAPTDDVGRRGLLATMSLIEGSLGEVNMGYTPVVEPFDADGFSWKNIWVDNLGQRNPSEIVEVRVAYDLAHGPLESVRESLPVAVGLELAHAFSGQKHRRTVRFLFLGNQNSPQTNVDKTAHSGGQAYAALMADRRVKVMAVIDLNAGDFEAGRFIAASGKIDFPLLMQDIDRLRAGILRAADQ